MRLTVSVPQLIAIVAIVVVLVFIATYASFSLGTGPSTVPAETQAVVEVLKFHETRREGPVLEWEVHQPGHYDFWFENQTDKPVKLTLDRVGCKCTTVELALLPDDARGEPREKLDSRAKVGVEWSPLTEKATRQVPPRGVGGIRLNWKGESVKIDTVNARFEVEGQGGVQQLGLEVPVMYVDAIRVTAEGYEKDSPRAENEAQLGTILSTESKSAKFIVWSSQRPFEPTLIPPGNPSVTYSEVVKLSEEESKKLSESRNTKVVAAYQFTVTVSEQGQSGRPADLGHFRFRVAVESADAKSEGLVSGVIRGDVTIGTAADRNMFDLVSFNATEGANKTLTLLTERSNLSLEVATAADLGDRKDRPLPYPDFLAPPVLKDVTKDVNPTGKAWELTVTVPANAWTGPIPPTSAVYLKLKGDKTRFIRIPIIGNAFSK
jgi:hypothetical protein